MPGFSSEDNYLNAVTTNGQIYKSFFSKQFNPTTAAAAGEWHTTMRGGGTPPADAIFNTGTNLTWVPTNLTTTNNTGIYSGGDVGASGMYKYLVAGSFGSAAATTAPATGWLVDVLGYYRVTSVTTTTAQATTTAITSVSVNFTADSSTDLLTHTYYSLLTGTRVQVSNSGGALPTGLSAATNYYVVRISDTTCKLATSYANAVASTPTTIDITANGSGTQSITSILPRYTNGAGVQAIFFNSNATALGAATPNLSLPSYTNSGQTAARATPTTLPIGKTAASNSLILYSGTGSGKYNPWVPLQAGDAGIAEIAQIQNSVSYVSGEYTVALVYPIAEFNTTTVGVICERDFKNVMGGPPRIYDGANLNWLIGSGAATPANSTFFGSLTFAWN
jgi:hypothetical protein